MVFRKNEIISLVGAPPRFELGESSGPDLRLAALFDADALGDLPLGYSTAAGDPEPRAAIAAAHGTARAMRSPGPPWQLDSEATEITLGLGASALSAIGSSLSTGPRKVSSTTRYASGHVDGRAR